MGVRTWKSVFSEYECILHLDVSNKLLQSSCIWMEFMGTALKNLFCWWAWFSTKEKVTPVWKALGGKANSRTLLHSLLLPWFCVLVLQKVGWSKQECLTKTFRMNSIQLVTSYGWSSRDYPRPNLWRLCRFLLLSCSLVSTKRSMGLQLINLVKYGYFTFPLLESLSSLAFSKMAIERAQLNGVWERTGGIEDFRAASHGSIPQCVNWIAWELYKLWKQVSRSLG